MTPGKLNLALYRGDTYRWQFKLWMDTNKTQPADLTGATVKAEAREASGGAVETTFVTTVTLPNIIDMSIDAAECGSMPETAKWDVQITYPSGDVQTILAGTIKVTDDVTDSTRTAPAMVLTQVQRR